MKKIFTRKIFWVFSILAVVAIVISILFLTVFFGKNNHGSVTFNKSGISSSSIDYSNLVKRTTGSADKSAVITNMTNDSDLIVTGTVNSIIPNRKIVDLNSKYGSQNEQYYAIDININIEETIKGVPYNEKQITIRVITTSMNDIGLFNETPNIDTSDLEKHLSGKLLLFLNKPIESMPSENVKEMTYSIWGRNYKSMSDIFVGRFAGTFYQDTAYPDIYKSALYANELDEIRYNTFKESLKEKLKDISGAGGAKAEPIKISPFDPNKKELSNTDIENLVRFKNTNIGNDFTVQYILKYLPATSYLERYESSIKGRPYGLSLYYKGNTPTPKALMTNAFTLFALIDNLDTVYFHFQNNNNAESASYEDISYSRQELETIFKGDLCEYASDPALWKNEVSGIISGNISNINQDYVTKTTNMYTKFIDRILERWGADENLQSFIIDDKSIVMPYNDAIVTKHIKDNILNYCKRYSGKATYSSNSGIANSEPPKFVHQLAYNEAITLSFDIEKVTEDQAIIGVTTWDSFYYKYEINYINGEWKFKMTECAIIN